MRHATRLGLGFAMLIGVVLLAEGALLGDDLRERLDALRVHHTEGRRRSKILVFPGNDARLREIIPRYLTPAAELEPPAGFYAGPVTVEATAAEPGHVLRYTLDGSIPTERSPRLAAPLSIAQTTVVRVRAFAFGKVPSAIATRTYLVDERSGIPVVSLVSDPINLEDSRTGIYANPKRNQAFGNRRQAHVEFFPAGGRGARLAFAADVEIHGGYSRNVPKKSFRIRYPSSAVVGADTGTALTAASGDDYQTAILRSGGNNWRWGIGDELFNAIYVDAPAAPAPRLVSSEVPCQLFLNGAYWGRYHIRERIDEDYLERAFGPGEYDLVRDRLAPWGKLYGSVPEAVAGDLDAWLMLLRWIRDADLADPAAYAEAERRIDVASLTDYWLHSIYAGNLDWPKHNVYRFRKRPDGRWLWIAWDSDQTFGLAEPHFNAGRTWIGFEDDTLARAVAPSPVDEPGSPFEGNGTGNLIVRKLLENPGYQQRFVARMFELLDTSFRPERVMAKLDALLAAAEPEIDRDLARWETPRADYDAIVSHVREFIAERPDVVRRQFRERFGAP